MYLLSFLIRFISRFIEHRDEVSFEQVNSTKGSSLSMHTGSVSLSLAEGCMHEVFVSSIVGGGEFTMQQTNSYHRQNVKKGGGFAFGE